MNYHQGLSTGTRGHTERECIACKKTKLISRNAVRCSSCQFDYRAERISIAHKRRRLEKKTAAAASPPPPKPERPVTDRVAEFYERAQK